MLRSFGLRLWRKHAMTPLQIRFATLAKTRHDPIAKTRHDPIATLTIRLTPTSLSSPIPTPNASRCHRAPLLLVYEGPQRWYRPCTTFQKILVPPIRYPWITRPPIRYPPWYHWDEPSSRCLARCPEHWRKHATQNSALRSFGLQLWRKHAMTHCRYEGLGIRHGD
jgi:hypothetical protein